MFQNEIMLGIHNPSGSESNVSMSVQIKQGFG
jgi:hypothetical protein